MRSLTLEGSWLTRERCLQPMYSRSVGFRYYSRNSTARSVPSPAQLLRFALTGTTRIPGTNYNDRKLDDRLSSQFLKRRVPKRSETLHDSLQSSEGFKFLTASEHDGLTKLHTDIESFVNSQKAGVQMMEFFSPVQAALRHSHTQVEMEDLLATVNALLARLQKFEVGNTQELLLLGMTYAAQCFSVPPLRHYLKQYSYGGHGLLARPFAIRLILALTSSLRLHIWENPTIDKTAMLNAIDGEKGNADSLSSHLDLSNIRENTLVDHYVRLLGALEGVDRVSDVWSDVLAELRIHPTPVLARSAISCIEAFIDSGNPAKAVQAAHNASEYMNLNEHISMALWKRLLEHDSQGLLRSTVSSNTTLSILADDLLPFEINLGATWTGGEEGRHLNSHTMEPFADNDDPSGIYDSSFDLGQDIPGTQLATRVLEIIKTDNGFNPGTKLSILTDLLNEHEGLEIPLGTRKVDQLGLLEYAWFPQSAPLEFVGDYPPTGCNMTEIPSAASLGLVRVRPDCNGSPLKSGEPIYIMQLGYIGVRRVSADNGRQTAEPEKWKASGHIIGWNRRNGQIMALWVGKGHGAVNPGLVRPSPPAEFPDSFGLVEFQKPSGLKMKPAGAEFPLANKGSFWIDVDPGHDLVR